MQFKDYFINVSYENGNSVNYQIFAENMFSAKSVARKHFNQHYAKSGVLLYPSITGFSERPQRVDICAATPKAELENLDIGECYAI